MSNWRLVKLKFGRSPAHFGELGIGMEATSDRVRSDTLFSAWMSTYARLFDSDTIAVLLQQFQDTVTPPVRMSSTFIYRQEGEHTIYYLPRPLKFPINYPKEDLKFFKTYKKLNFLPLEIWHRWYQGQGFTSEDERELIEQTEKKTSSGTLKKAGTFDYSKAVKIGQTPKIAVDRITRATNLYHTGFVQYQWKQNGSEIQSLSGLYFLLYFPQVNPQLEANLQAALHLLGEEGIGGERSSGAGRFELEWMEESQFPKTWKEVVAFTTTPAHHCLISLFWDNDAAKLAELVTNVAEARYEIQERGGWISAAVSGPQLRRQSVRMFAEGSVFPIQPQGKLADVTPLNFGVHPIYRSGISLSLPIKVS